MRPTPRFSPWTALLGAVLAFGPATQALAAGEPVDVLAVTASSTDGMLMDAVDGDATTAWQNKREGEPSAWIAVRFAEAAKLKGVRIHTEALGPDVAIDVESSADGETYAPALKAQHVLKDAPVEWKFKKPLTALYLRVRFSYTGAKTAPRFRLKELEALSP